MKNPNIYASRELDRAGHLRRDEGWIRQRLADRSSRVLAVWRSRSLVLEGDMPRTVLLDPEQ
ncbi:MAG: NAD(+) diphosphatase, partial [Alphaproteobacteria bacterium]